MSVALLAGIVSEQRTHLTPQDVEPYHERAAAAIDGIPYVIGTWTGAKEEVPLAAQKLLKPNAILSRSYQDNSDSDANRPERRKVSLDVNVGSFVIDGELQQRLEIHCGSSCSQTAREMNAGIVRNGGGDCSELRD